jgi:hypothetical protein
LRWFFVFCFQLQLFFFCCLRRSELSAAVEESGAHCNICASASDASASDAAASNAAAAAASDADAAAAAGCVVIIARQIALPDVFLVIHQLPIQQLDRKLYSKSIWQQP